MTSLSSEEDRARGLAAGADAYIVKGEFEQARFSTRSEGSFRRDEFWWSIVPVPSGSCCSTRSPTDQALEVVGVAKDGEEAIALCQSLRPDIMTIARDLPGLDGLAVTRRLMAELPTPIIIITSDETAVSMEALAPERWRWRARRSMVGSSFER